MEKIFYKHLIIIHKNEIFSSDIRSNGKYVITGGGDNLINMYDIEKMEKIQAFEGDEKEIYSLYFNYGNDVKKFRVEIY